MLEKIFKIILTVAGIMILTTPVFAATTVLFSPSNVTVENGKRFTLRLIAYPHGAKNYTAIIQVRYPQDLLRAETFTFASGWMAVSQYGYDGIDNANGVLIKTAGYPGGFSEPILFGTISFLSKKIGDGLVRVGGYSLVLDRSSQNVLVSPFGQATISVKKEGIIPLEKEAIPEEGITLEEEGVIPLEEEIIPEKEIIIPLEEEIIPTPLFDIIIEPGVKEKRSLMPIIIVVLLAIAILVTVSYIIYRKKKKSLLKDVEDAENSK